MGNKQDLEKSLHDAMKSGDVLRKNTLRLALSSIQLAEVEKHGALDDPTILTILQKEVKMRRETIQDAEKGNRKDIVDEKLAEIKILESFLPKQLSEAEIMELAKKAIQETGAGSVNDSGKVMKVLMPLVAGRAPGDQISKIVRQLLQN
ncbi:MAG: GatB/YqeY domain-containing protein [Anaerolineaceae bacterium]|jgi:hypothetical protein